MRIPYILGNVLLALAICSCGQSKDQVPVRVKSHTQNASSKTSATVIKAEQTSAAKQASAVLTITGRDFSGTAFNPPALERGGVQVLKHYGNVDAKVFLKREVKSVRVHLAPRPVKGGFPIVNVYAVSDKGNFSILKDQVVSKDEEFTRKLTIPTGSYKVRVDFATDTKKGSRPHLEIRQIVFE